MIAVPPHLGHYPALEDKLRHLKEYFRQPTEPYRYRGFCLPASGKKSSQPLYLSYLFSSQAGELVTLSKSYWITKFSYQKSDSFRRQEADSQSGYLQKGSYDTNFGPDFSYTSKLTTDIVLNWGMYTPDKKIRQAAQNRWIRLHQYGWNQISNLDVRHRPPPSSAGYWLRRMSQYRPPRVLWRIEGNYAGIHRRLVNQLRVHDWYCKWKPENPFTLTCEWYQAAPDYSTYPPPPASLNDRYLQCKLYLRQGEPDPYSATCWGLYISVQDRIGRGAILVIGPLLDQIGAHRISNKDKLPFSK